MSLEQVSKRYKGIIAKHQSNPFPVDISSIEFFINLKTLNIFHEKDRHIHGRKEVKRVLWYPLPYHHYVNAYKEGFICRRVVLDKEDKDFFFKNTLQFVNEFHHHCFSETLSLTSFQVPSTVTSIGSNCFSFCSNLVSIELPHHLSTIEERCFHECCSLSLIDLPIELRSMKNYCFAQCSNLRNISIPENVTSIENCCFYSCIKLQSIHLPNGLLSIGNNCFSHCHELDQLIIPDSVTFLGKQCCTFCMKLTKITLSNQLTSIDTNCFKVSNNILEINIPLKMHSSSCEWIHELKHVTQISIPPCHFAIGNRIMMFSDEILCSLTIPTSVKSIVGDMTSVSNGLSVNQIFKSIANDCFKDCLHINDMSIPASVESLGERSFVNCSNLKHLIFSQDHLILNDYCFANCSQLQFIDNLPNDLQIGKGCFMNCNQLDESHNHVKTLSEKYQLFSMITEKQLHSVESYCNMQFKSIYYDSDIFQGTINLSSLYHYIKSQSKSILLIQSNKNMTFGVYFDTVQSNSQPSSSSLSISTTNSVTSVDSQSISNINLHQDETLLHLQQTKQPFIFTYYLDNEVKFNYILTLNNNNVFTQKQFNDEELNELNLSEGEGDDNALIVGNELILRHLENDCEQQTKNDCLFNYCLSDDDNAQIQQFPFCIEKIILIQME